MEMNVKHTPGPWFTGELLANVYFGNKSGEMIAQCGGFKFKQKMEGESEANACLIAAAPDLLDVLLRMTEYADDGTPIHPSDNLMAEARAAVAKAVGVA